MISRTFLKKIALFLVFTMVYSVVYPTISYALTSGPVAPEASGFSVLQTSDMVDHFTGDFRYSLPLLDIPGMGDPFNLSLNYSSPTGVEKEASMVGHGWDLNIGNIARNMRGIPDDFNGDHITRTLDSKPNWTIGVQGQVNLEIFTFDWLKLNPGLRASIMYNSYKGLGLSLGPSLNFGIPENEVVDVGLGADINSFEGSSWSSSISLSNKLKSKEADIGSLGVGLNFGGNNMSGLKTFGFSAFGNAAKASSQFGMSLLENPISINFGPNEYKGKNLKIGFKTGVTIFWSQGYATPSAYFNIEELKHAGQAIQTRALGTMYSHNFSKYSKVIHDFGRDNDGVLRESQLYLHTNHQDFDNFLVNANGLSGSFKTCRSDIGTFEDIKNVKSNINGLDISGEVAGGNAVEVGADLRVMKTITSNSEKGEIEAKSYQFTNNTNDLLYEPYYFRFDDEMTTELTSPTFSDEPNYQNYDYINSDEPIAHQINRTPHKRTASIYEFNTYKISGNVVTHKEAAVSIEEGTRENRMPRSKNIRGLRNCDLKHDTILEGGSVRLAFPPYHIQYLNAVGINDINTATEWKDVDRDFGKDKLTGFTITKEGGEQYHFAIPMLNHRQDEYIFSVDVPKINGATDYCAYKIDDIPLLQGGKLDYKPDNQFSEQFLDHRKIPSYASNFGLTSITGLDYVDIDPGDGAPNYKDRGRWYRIDYIKTNDKGTPYKWRMPYSGARYQSGYRNLEGDDKASFTYGERDQYYVRQIESPTHYAKFYYSNRNDARGATKIFQSSQDAKGAFSQKLDSIQLFVKNSATPENGNGLIKTVVFQYYPNGAWPQIPNTTQPNDGKLTLEKVIFYNYNSRRGQLNPYEFEYFNESRSVEYHENRVDRWGVYKGSGADECDYLYAPYTKQFNTDYSPVIDELDEEIRTYHLSSIKLPSGAKIKIDVSRDHYGYVQDKIAGQMFKIASTTDPTTQVSNQIAVVGNAQGDQRRLYFQLEEELPVDPLSDITLDQYFVDLYEDKIGKQVYFKVLTDVTGTESKKEFVTGYGHITDWGFASPDGSGMHKYAYIEFLPVSETIEGDLYHPILFFAWQEIKLNLKQLILPTFPISNLSDNKQIASSLIQFFSKIGEYLNVFKGFYDHCFQNNRGANLDLDHSYIRLCSPDKMKYGGNVRVTKIALTESWNKEETPDYGFVYDYTDEETIMKNGQSITRLISSGVASNEPHIGDEESSLRLYKAIS